MNRRICKGELLLALTAFLLLSCTALAQDNVDLTGTWESRYGFGEIEEVMTANIVQVDESLLGSFSVKQSPSGEQYSGILFGKIEGKNARVYYLSVRDQEKKDPSLSVAFADGRISDKDTLKGTFYYQDSNQIGLSGPYEAHKV
jgi:hypothetical protein